MLRTIRCTCKGLSTWNNCFARQFTAHHELGAESVMRKILMCSAAAAALLFAVPIASAQSPGDQEKDHKAAPERMTPQQHVAPKPGKETQGRTSNEMRPGETNKGRAAQEERKEEKGMRPGETNKGTTAQEERKEEKGMRPGETNKGTTAQEERKEEKGMRPGETNKGTTAQEEKKEEKGMKPGETNKGTSAQEENKGTPMKSDRAEQTNERKDHASEAQQLTPAKQDKIREAVKKEHVENVSHADFSLNVGAVIPPRYNFRPLPSEIFADVPEYRGYDYLVVNDEIVIVQPESHKIVYAMAESQSAANDRPCH
jgi:hypothetical protein